MRHKFFTKFLSCLRPLFTSLLIVIFSSIPLFSSYAGVYEGVRTCDYNRDASAKKAYMCTYDTLEFNPFKMADSSATDINLELTNPTCIGFMAAVGTATIASKVATKIACASPYDDANPAPLSYTIPAMIAAAFTTCIALSIAPGGSGAACCVAAGVQTGMVAASVAALAVIYAMAKKSFEYSRICGHDWLTWARVDANGNESLNVSDGWKRGRYTGSHQKALYDMFVTNGTSANKSITNQSYREFIYGGIEYEDIGNNACTNPTTWDNSKQDSILGYHSDHQRYYMTGSGMAGVFACHRFLASGNDAGAQAAYNCCKERGKKVMCFESVTGLDGSLGSYDSVTVGSGDRNYTFCEQGSRCSVGGVSYETFASKVQSNYLCAKSYSVCPYNHMLGGGTEIKSLYTDTAHSGQVINFCQFMNHCQKLPITPHVATSSLGAGFISKACRDLKGDSQNTYEYAQNQLPGISTRSFSAPMVQCFKETMENLLLNKAGYTACLDPDQSPDENGMCPGGDFLYQEGHDLRTPSFFSIIQDRLQDIIRMGLAISVMFFGVMILLGMKPIEKKQLLVYILKMGLVMYFAVGDGWHQLFMDKMLNTSTFLAELTFRPDVSSDPAKQDGCQFPRYDYANQSSATKYLNPTYPPGKSYLAVWDTLDCKLGMALGFGPEVTVPNLVLMIVGGFFTGGLGIIFVVGAFCFAFFLFSLTVRAIHIFLLSMTSVVILIFVSPIPITLAMFAKTKNIFDQWWKQLLGFTLQPMILFAYLGIMITVFDKVVVGDATFVGDGHGAPKTIDCNNPGSDAIWHSSFVDRVQDSSGVHNSIYCIFRVADIHTYSGLEAIGIGVPVLLTMTKDKISTIIQAALLMFIFSSFMDKITRFAQTLVGGVELKPTWQGSTADMAAKAAGIARGIQKRGMGLGKKVVTAAGGAVARKGVEIARSAGSKGKKTADRAPAAKDAAPVAAPPGAAAQVAGAGPAAPPVAPNPPKQ